MLYFTVMDHAKRHSNKQPSTSADEQVCIDTIAKLRWPNGPVCPKCEELSTTTLTTQKRWKCKKCGRQFSVKVGTIFEDSPISLDKWFAALWMLVNCKNGI